MLPYHDPDAWREATPAENLYLPLFQDIPRVYQRADGRLLVFKDVRGAGGERTRLVFEAPPTYAGLAAAVETAVSRGVVEEVKEASREYTHAHVAALPDQNERRHYLDAKLGATTHLDCIPGIEDLLADATEDDLEVLKALNDQFRADYYPHLDEGAFDPPDAATRKWLVLFWWPDVVRRIRSEVTRYSHRTQTGLYLQDVRTFLKDSGILVEMLEMAYAGRGIRHEDFLDLVEKTDAHPCLVHLDHFIAALPDEPFHFVAMIAPSNNSFSYARRHRAKAPYVGEESVEPICETWADVCRESSALYP